MAPQQSVISFHILYVTMASYTSTKASFMIDVGCTWGFDVNTLLSTLLLATSGRSNIIICLSVWVTKSLRFLLCDLIFAQHKSRFDTIYD